MSEKACYTVRELSSRWGCSRDTVDRMIKTGTSRCSKTTAWSER